MKNDSRIRFNPVTKEIEVEGTEEFVKTYFDKLQAMVSGSMAPIKAEKKELGEKRVTNIDRVLSLIQGSAEGISTAELKEKTGFSEGQIWSIVARAKKKGKIKQGHRGMYVAV